MADAKKKFGLFSALHTHEDALTLIKYASRGFYFLAALQIGVGLLLGVATVTDGLLYLILGFLMYRFRSRVAASLLLLLSLGGLIVTVTNIMGLSSMGGTNLFLAVLVCIFSARAVEATFKLHGSLKQPTGLAEPLSTVADKPRIQLARSHYDKVNQSH